ncbi:agamous-like MADS-box protein AGL80 [Aristolochia californica]|uniref:agamous-like MADS-box protein AGL80 n=1 Tax=Aristolochia californica TaxID=171875 RepID=UPI0035E0A2E4
MARKKVKLAWIANDAARKATYKKRKKGLLKKVSELSILCGVEASAVVIGPNEQQPEVWPSVHEAQRILLKFKTLPEMDQGKKMMNQEGFFRQRIEKLKEQAKRWTTENREIEMDALMYQCLSGRSLEDLVIEDLTELGKRIETKTKAVQQRVEIFKRTESQPPAPATAKQTPGFWAVAAARGKVNKVETNEHKSGNGETTALQAAMEALQRQQWLVEMMNPHEPMGVGDGNEAVNPFGDASSWFDALMGDI